MAKRRARAPEPRPHTFDLVGMSVAIRDFLGAAGLEVDGTDLEATPNRVARAFRESFLDGYDCDPSRVFEEAYPAGATPPPSVLLKGIPLHGLCPHHLLPYYGHAHLAYVPGRRLASLSSLARLVDCFAHRLEIQETVTRQIAESMRKELGARGSAVVLEADQTCMTLRSPERKGTRTVTQHFTGVYAKKSDLRLEFLKSLEALR
jgi:GTP cyclohydrolase I